MTTGRKVFLTKMFACSHLFNLWGLMRVTNCFAAQIFDIFWCFIRFQRFSKVSNWLLNDFVKVMDSATKFKSESSQQIAQAEGHSESFSEIKTAESPWYLPSIRSRTGGFTPATPLGYRKILWKQWNQEKFRNICETHNSRCFLEVSHQTSTKPI